LKLKNKKNKIIVAMSGGVDSSVAAKLLVDQGHEVAGIFLHFWKDGNSEIENKCCSTKALSDAHRVCQKIGIPLYTLNFTENFKKEVVDNFVQEYRSGKTPNPCVICNKRVKLGMLIKKARELGFEFVASGHYVKKLEIRNQKSEVIYKLQKAKDSSKDQSYFLYTFNQEELGHLIFPLGDYKKTEVRVMAKKFKLPTAEKKESQEICFIPEKSHNEFLKRYLKLKSGKIKTLEGKILGEHQGLPLYTIGQRRGVEIGGTGPYYVVSADIKNNILFVSKDGNDAALFKNSLVAKNINWLSGEEPKFPFICEAVIRYRHKSVGCKLTKSGKNIKVNLNEAQRAVTPGQSVVFYKGEEILGGGIIK
jgi:tRNA-uridine 2-sulfurtransferase